MAIETMECEMECSQCECALTEDTAIETLDSGIVCEDCESNDFVECVACNGTVHCRMTHGLANGDELCQTCFDSGDYIPCNNCSGLVPMDEAHSVYDEYSVCGDCIDGYFYCDECDMYVADNDGDHDHSSSEGCQCEARSQTFAMRNDGFGMLDNDSRTVVALPSGVVSPQGMEAIAQLIRAHALSLEDLEIRRAFYSVSYHVQGGGVDSRWQTSEGNLTKRLSRWTYKNCKVKLPPEIVSQIGNIANAHSAGQDYAIEFTRNLNLPAEDFAHADSCWWQSYSESRCALKANGGMGIRTFSEDDGVTGRAWIIPMHSDADGFRPTDDTSARCFMVFNGYGNLSGYAAARILAHMQGMTYRKVTFYGSPMYINGDVGYLVAPEDIAESHTDGSIRLSLSEC